MIPWQLHEFKIAPGQRERFLALWRTRLMPLADRHGPCIAGCWTEGDDRFIWLSSCAIHGTDDALAEEWPAMLGRHRGLGTMDVSCILSEPDFSPLGARIQQAKPPLEHRLYELAEERLKPGGEEAANLAREMIVPLARDVGLDLIGVWTSPATSQSSERVIWMTGFADEPERQAKQAAFQADPRFAVLTSQMETPARSRVLEPCDFSPLGPA